MSASRSSTAAATGVAIAAALSFGATTPIIARAGRGVGPLATAALLYAGAALSAFAMGRVWPAAGVPLRRRDFRRIVAIALLGAGLAPTLLAWGLQRAGATVGSLLLNLEAVFTVLVARAVYREWIGPRVALAVLLMVLGGAALALDRSATATPWSFWGALAIAGATAAWALDNVLTRALSETKPVSVVASKALLGTCATSCAALAWGETLPSVRPALVLLACGATGYGLSLRLYLLAQRRLGAARTGSIFAVGPFFGAALALALGDRAAGPGMVVATALLGLGVFLHASEHHHHRHSHRGVDHDHSHRHDDSHHFHTHDSIIVGEHAHVHHHESLEHDHEHSSDIHHAHEHTD